MTVNVLFFGPLTDKVSTTSIQVNDIKDTETLLAHLASNFPLLNEVQFSLSVNRKFVHQNIPLHHGDEVACLPPFSGG